MGVGSFKGHHLVSSRPLFASRSGRREIFEGKSYFYRSPPSAVRSLQSGGNAPRRDRSWEVRSSNRQSLQGQKLGSLPCLATAGARWTGRRTFLGPVKKYRSPCPVVQLPFVIFKALLGPMGAGYTTGRMSHSSGMISEDVALTSGSQVNILRMYLRSCSFSSPGGMVVTKSSRLILRIRTSEVHWPARLWVIEADTGCAREPRPSLETYRSRKNRSSIIDFA